ncbi:MAG: hypothetical protein HY721_35410 [Planctomycetes bacterium]|nr:hypothetical protein [Planctomycetota bacterium]
MRRASPRGRIVGQPRCGPGIRARHVALALLLAAPPAARVGLHVARARQAAGPPDVTEAASGPRASSEALLAELAAAREDLRRARLDLDLRGAPLPQGRYEPVLADVLPASDPSPGRSLLWAVPRGPRPVPRDSAATHPAVQEGGEPAPSLAGRVVRVHPGLGPAPPILGVQTLLDPGFRVRFRHAGASGVLWGTGQAAEGHALLELRHLTAEVDLKEGDPVFTEGQDGVYPPRLLVGSLVRRKAGAAGPERLAVRAALRVEDLTRLVIPVDLAARATAELSSTVPGKGTRP